MSHIGRGIVSNMLERRPRAEVRKDGDVDLRAAATLGSVPTLWRVETGQYEVLFASGSRGSIIRYLAVYLFCLIEPSDVVDLQHVSIIKVAVSQ